MLDRKERSKEKWEQVAINESAMAVAAMNMPNFGDIQYVWTLHAFEINC